MARRYFILILLSVAVAACYGQATQFSLATDASLFRSFKEGQRYWAIGQTVHAHFHFSPKGGAYAWLSYYSPGRFTNKPFARAKSPGTVPQVIRYDNRSELRVVHLSLGWKRYFRGDRESEKGWNFYCLAGFGLMIGTVTNTHSITLDSSAYFVPVLPGKANFKRLTFDIGTGAEVPVGGDVYIYSEARVLIPTTDYPSPFLFVNRGAPLVGTANIGLRILFR